MRKLLLATVAALGASMGVATVADAQTATPAPGTVTVRLNGRFRFFAGIVEDRDANTPGNKLTNYQFGEYARLYPGFDGVAANGLKYGASLEIRQDNAVPPGGGVNGSVSASNRGRGSLYLRREWGYIGTNELGTLRVGSVDSPSSLYMTGNFENFNDGGLNGDIEGTFNATSTAITWPFADVGSLYTTSKAVYLSPQFYGFDFGISYEPNTGAVDILSGNCSNATPSSGVSGQVFGTGVATGCDRLSSTALAGELGRRRNTVDALVRYRGTFGSFGVAATASYIGSGRVNDSTGLASGNGVGGTTGPSAGAGAFGSPTGTPRYAFDGLSLGDFGLAVTYAGLSVGGKYQFGRYNGQWNLVPRNYIDANAILVGASYTVGPLVVGGHALRYISAGDLNAAGQRHENGLALGSTYTLAPGLSLFTGYLYSTRVQNGFNFITNSSANPTAANNFNDPRQHNKVTSQILYVGTSFTW